MTTANFGLKDTGYLAPTYDEILDAMQEEMLRVFPNDIVLTSNSNLGILSRIFALKAYEMIQAQQQIYYSAYVTQAEGTSLDRLGANYGLPRKVDKPARASITIVTDGEYLVEKGEKFQTDDGYIFELTDDVLTAPHKGVWQGIGVVESEDTGEETNVAANTITNVFDPDSNILSVTNPEKAAGGQDYEDDQRYRARILMENANRPSPTKQGVKSALMNVQGVRDVNIVENQFSTADKYGNPPYSVHIYVLGGRKQDIADCLIDHIAIGITLTGSTYCDAVDDTGNTKRIYFDFATDRPIYVKVNIKTNSDWNVDEGTDYVRQTIVDYVNRLKMGDTVYLTRLYPELYSIAGIEDVQVELGKSADETAQSDVVLDQFEAPSCSIENVEVTVDGR